MIEVTLTIKGYFDDETVDVLFKNGTDRATTNMALDGRMCQIAVTDLTSHAIEGKIREVIVVAQTINRFQP